jgi:polyferredoxin
MKQHKFPWQPVRYIFLAITLGIYLYFYYLKSEGSHIPLWLFWWAWFGIVLILLPALFGRWGCGWMCMYSAVIEFVTKRLKYPRLQLPKWMHSWYWLYGFFMFFGSAEIFWDLDFYLWYVHIFDVVAVGIGLFIIPRHWCRYICPLGTGSMVYGRIRTFGIKAEPEKCIHCKKGCVWAQVCPMHIDGEKEVVDKGRRSVPTHCILCMQCVQKCPGRVPTFGRVRWMKKKSEAEEEKVVAA